MPYINLYAAQITQTGDTIIPNINSDLTTITGSWVSGSISGSYNFISSGSFSGASSSITGGLELRFEYDQINFTTDTGSIRFARLDENTLQLVTKPHPLSLYSAGNVMKGTCSIDIKIQY
jgi:hypothetical protein